MSIVEPLSSRQIKGRVSGVVAFPDLKMQMGCFTFFSGGSNRCNLFSCLNSSPDPDKIGSIVSINRDITVFMLNYNSIAVAF